MVTATVLQYRHSSCSEGTGFTESTKNEKSYAFYCRFSVSVLESTAALEAEIVPAPFPYEIATTHQPQALPEVAPGFALQTSVQVRT